MHGNFSRVCLFTLLTWTILWSLETGCAFSYKKVGCFKDDRKNPRPVPVLVFTDRDVSSDVWSGKTIDWNNWDTYIVDLVCRCVNESRARNYSHFSIQYYGNCQAIVRGFSGNWVPTLLLSPLRAKLWSWETWNESRARNYSPFSFQYYGNWKVNIVRGFWVTDDPPFP